MVTATSAWLLAMAVGPFGRTARAQSIPSDAQGGCPVAGATFATWFETGTPAPDGVVKPADSVNFPGVPNWDFYTWSKQMFLWLTSPAPATASSAGIGRWATVFEECRLHSSDRRDMAVTALTLLTRLPARSSEVESVDLRGNIRPAMISAHRLFGSN